MNWLNRISIKARLLLLVVFPLTFSAILALIEVNYLLERTSHLKVLSVQLTMLSDISDSIELGHKMRVAKLEGEVANADEIRSVLFQIRQKLSQSTLHRSSTHNEHSVNTSDTLNEIVLGLSEAYDEYPQVVKEDVQEWSFWVFDYLAELILLYEKQPIYTGVENLEQQVRIMYQLTWILFWDYEADWSFDLERAFPELNMEDELISFKNKQQLFIDRFITISADPDQIKLLLDTFSSKPFIEAQSFKQRVAKAGLSSIPQDEIDSGIQALNTRLVMLSDGLRSVMQTLNNQIYIESRSFEYRAYFYTALILLILLIIGLLGFSLIRRILFYLSNVLETMQRIEETHDYSIKMYNDGHDELSQFTFKLNNLLEERYLNESKIVQAREEAEQASKAKSSFLANMSHEIRTPLNGIIGMSEVLSDTHLTPTQLDHVSVIETSSQTLLILINDILDLSKIESGKLSIATHSSNFREVIYDTLLIVVPKAVAKSLDLKVNIPPHLPHSLMLDEHRLRQILMNLMSNAVKFTDLGSVTVDIDFVAISSEKILLTVSVIDTGIGIEKAQQKKIFQPFTQEDGSITRRFGGTGLGLTISAQLVGLMGGEIYVDSQQGEGSRFYFSIEVNVESHQPVVPKTLHHQMLILISNHVEFKEGILKEITLYGLDVTRSVETIQELDIDDTSYAKSPIILYCYVDLTQAKEELKVLRARFPALPVVMCQSLMSERFDFGKTIDGLITVPILGQRFIKALVNAHFTHGVNTTDTIDTDTAQVNDSPSKVEQVSEFNDKRLILVVEDNLVNQKVATMLLKKGGYDYDIANNGQEAVDKVRSGEQYSVILMDCMMPIKDGFRATEEIRAYEKDNGMSPVAIIALTASVLDEDIQHCFDCGMDDYTAKPFKKELLLAKIDKYIQLLK
ncbi:ATP-binding protein [uncultured Shewanella sp.]|uniref:hybrid sensor histidine kinase/response regulator n=1 Tax=uncultured Shewanella sp. TaxID=173975 RepID=UPI002613FEBE|nr:ATP-binding protein [uncultured Shewanella sp.]